MTAWVGVFETLLHITTADHYYLQFDLDGDESTASLWIDGKVLAQCTCCSEAHGSVHLSSGNHHVSVLYSGNGVGDSIQISYQGADSPTLAPVPCSAWAPGVVCCDTAATTTPCPGSLLEDAYYAGVASASASILNEQEEDDGLDDDTPEQWWEQHNHHQRRLQREHDQGNLFFDD